MRLFLIISSIWISLSLSNVALAEGSSQYNGDPNMMLSQSDTQAEGVYNSCVDSNCGVAAVQSGLLQDTVASDDNINKLIKKQQVK